MLGGCSEFKKHFGKVLRIGGHMLESAIELECLEFWEHDRDYVIIGVTCWESA